MGIYKIKPNIQKYSHVENNKFELCKFPCMYLTHFRPSDTTRWRDFAQLTSNRIRLHDLRKIA